MPTSAENICRCGASCACAPCRCNPSAEDASGPVERTQAKICSCGPECGCDAPCRCAA